MDTAFGYRRAMRAIVAASLLFASGCATLSGVPDDVLNPKRLYPQCGGDQQVAPARGATERRAQRAQKVPAGSWMVSDALYCHPDKATRDAAYKTMMEEFDQSGEPMDMPFDGKRMVIGGFTPILEKGASR